MPYDNLIRLLFENKARRSDVFASLVVSSAVTLADGAVGFLGDTPALLVFLCTFTLTYGLYNWAVIGFRKLRGDWYRNRLMEFASNQGPDSRKEISARREEMLEQGKSERRIYKEIVAHEMATTGAYPPSGE